MNWQEEYRELFPAVRQCVYMDNAYDCGSTTFGVTGVEKYFRDWTKAAVTVERGGPGRASHFKVLDATREQIARLCGADTGDRVAFTRNTNEGLNAILQGFDFRPGDNIITDAIEHHSVIMPALNAEKTRGIEVRVLSGRPDERIPVEDLMALADEHTRMVCVSHVQSVTGYRIDLNALGHACRKRGIFLVVDAIQSIGLETFRMDDWCVDAVNGAGYKGLNAVNSIGFTVYTRELLAHIWPVYIAAGFCNDVRWNGRKFELVCSDAGNARKMENSSLDNPGIYVLHESLAILETTGIERIHDQIMRLYGQLYTGLKALGYPLTTPENESEHLGILALKPADPQKMFDHFRSHNIALSISGGDHVRFSLGGFNNEADIQAVLAAAALYNER